MRKLTSSVPKYGRHKASGQAVVTLGGRDFYLGKHGTAASKAEAIASGILSIPRVNPAMVSITNVLGLYKCFLIFGTLLL